MGKPRAWADIQRVRMTETEQNSQDRIENECTRIVDIQRVERHA